MGYQITVEKIVESGQVLIKTTVVDDLGSIFAHTKNVCAESEYGANEASLRNLYQRELDKATADWEYAMKMRDIAQQRLKVLN